MARPIKKGLDYFSMDVYADQDEKIQLLEFEKGVEGFGVLIKLYMEIYKNGYFLEWTEKKQKLFCRNKNIPTTLLIDVVDICLKENLFNHKLFKKYGILTSPSLQKRYIKGVERRSNVELVKNYLLIDMKFVYDSINKVNVNINEINDDKKYINNSKVNNSKEKKSSLPTQEEKNISTSFDEFKASSTEKKPQPLTDELVLEQTVADFKDMRKKIKAPMTDKAIGLLKTKLQKLSGGDVDIQIKILEQSIMNSRKGVFALKDGAQKKRTPQTNSQWINEFEKAGTSRKFISLYGKEKYIEVKKLYMEEGERQVLESNKKILG